MEKLLWIGSIGSETWTLL